ncbi:MAG TPA: glycosyltransferase [Chloroflexota bacterium]|jgi:glycosyltransferase involved in cell wall biosynthesis
MRVALVHDYLNQPGGAEHVVEVLHHLFPEAPLFTSVYDRDAMPDFWRQVDVRTTFMQRISPRLRVAKRLLPLYPYAFESLDLSGFDLVLSSCSTFSKGVITPPRTLHVCYCHNTTRFLWMYHQYLAHERVGVLQRALLRPMVTPLRAWDFQAAQRVDHFIANSRGTADRIRNYYRRSSAVIEPPVRTAEFLGGDGSYDSAFLVVSRLQSYKRIDLAVQAATRLGLPLLVAGRGPDEARLRALSGPTVRFLGRVTNRERVRLMQHCAALVVPGREDFGLATVETLAAGRPILAYAAGGSLEIVIDGKTGAFFREPTTEALEAAMRRFKPGAYDPAACRERARHFDIATFGERLRAHLDTLITAHRSDGPLGGHV